MVMVFWDYPSLAIGFMNDEHATFVDLINEAGDALTMGRFSVQHFKRLVQHCQEHFAHEEREMQRTQFRHFQAHKHEHDRVLTEMLALLANYEQDESVGPLLDYVQDTLPDWFVRHLNSMDRVTAGHLARHSAATA